MRALPGTSLLASTVRHRRILTSTSESQPVRRTVSYRIRAEDPRVPPCASLSPDDGERITRNRVSDRGNVLPDGKERPAVPVILFVPGSSTAAPSGAVAAGAGAGPAQLLCRFLPAAGAARTSLAEFPERPVVRSLPGAASAATEAGGLALYRANWFRPLRLSGRAACLRRPARAVGPERGDCCRAVLHTAAVVTSVNMKKISRLTKQCSGKRER